MCTDFEEDKLNKLVGEGEQTLTFEYTAYMN